MQPNTQVWITANVALLACGYNPFLSASNFTAGIPWIPGYQPGMVDKYQQQSIVFLDLTQRQLGIVMNKRFMIREFQFTTVPGVSQYQFNSQIVEGFKANSFFNVTNGNGPGNPIHVVSYESFCRAYARPDLIPIGAPTILVPLVDDGSSTTTVRLVPTPDQAYTIKGLSRLIVPQIKDGTDQTIFPFHYEHALIYKLQEYLEHSSNEGRDVSARVYAEQFIAEVMRDASGAEEEIDQLDFGIRLYGRRGESRRDFNPLTDVPTQLQ